MIEIVYRYEPGGPPRGALPRTASEAREVLEEGNRRFVELLNVEAGDHREVIPFDPRALGVSTVPGEAPEQTPFAIVLGCADARVPTELVFHRAANDLFVVRVAGNVLGAECMGSIEYATAHLRESVRLARVLGHTGCGAVTAAVDAFLSPGDYPSVASSHGLRSIVDRVFVAVRAAALALEAARGDEVENDPGYRKALIETSVVANAALTGLTLRQELGGRLDVVFGVYDLVSRRVGVPLSGEEPGVGLRNPPEDLEGLRDLGLRAARSPFIEAFLERS